MAATKISISLRPTTSATTTRYDNRLPSNEPQSQVISPRLFSPGAEPEPHYLPPHWSACLHPEGNVYFLRDTKPMLITEAYLYNPVVLQKILTSAKKIDDIIGSRAGNVSESAEVVLQINDEDDDCSYYLIDHDSRVQYWLDAVDSSDLGIPATVSDGHLRLALEELYWQHVEFFPSHLNTRFNPMVTHLKDCFLQAKLDQLTSEVSTFTYDVEQCDEFINLLDASANRVESPQMRWVIARLWGCILNHRVITHCGQEHARLSRDQSILAIPPAYKSRLYRLSSWLLFNIPELYNHMFEELWLDERVYVKQWRQFIETCNDEWKLSASIAFALLMSNVLLTMSPVPFRGDIAVASILLSHGSILAACTLLMQHRRSERHTAGQAATFIVASQDDKRGFQTVATLFALPRALLLWALVTFSAQVLLAFLSVSQLCTMGIVCVLSISFGKLALWVSRKFQRTFQDSDMIPSGRDTDSIV